MILLLATTFVFAAGSSTVPSTTSDTNSDADNTSVDTVSNNTKAVDVITKTKIESVKERLKKSRTIIRSAVNSNSCDSLEDRAHRISCRLKRYKDNPEENDTEVDYEKRVPEACKSGRNPTACIALYKRVNNNGCYSLQGKNKDRCFKKTLDMKKAKIRDLPPQERKEKARDYLVLLLYEIQERIEKANENDKISDDDATEIIDLIVEIKQDILDNKTRSEILPKLKDLKEKIRALRSGTETE